MSIAALAFANASCAHCVRLITGCLREFDGVRLMEVDPVGHRILLEFDPVRASLHSIRALLERYGYPTVLAEIPARPTSSTNHPLEASRD